VTKGSIPVLVESTRIQYLDGIRALAIAAVLILHWVGSQTQAGLGGYIGVDVFFALSGYIITTILWRSRSTAPIGSQWRRFIARRIRRLYPALVGMVVGTIVLFLVVPGAPLGLDDLVPMGALALGQGYSFFAAAEIGPLGPFAVTWSLAVEWMFYLFWPLVVFSAKSSRMPARTLARWAAIAAIAIYAVALLQGNHWFYYGPFARVPEIIAGGVLALLVISEKPARRPTLERKVLVGASAVGLVLFVIYTAVAPVQWSPIFRLIGAPLAVAVTLLLIWSGHRASDIWLTRLLSLRPLTFIGRSSYSIYLWHNVPLAVLTRESLPGVPLWIVALIGVSSSLVLSLLSYRFLELPYMRSKTAALEPARASEEPNPDRGWDDRQDSSAKLDESQRGHREAE
jgi:peptidoglycan/LPS O-acetylase OafA/YrhL